MKLSDGIRALISRKSEEESEYWMIPYCTLMMALMVLFAALYMFSSGNPLAYEMAAAAASEGKGKESAKREMALIKDLKGFVDNVRNEGVAEVEVTAREIRLKLQSPVVYESGSAELRPEVMPLLLKLFDHLKAMDNLIVVEGHTDDIPIHTAEFQSNWELSAARAFSIIRFYIDRGIRPERLVAHGYGPNKPLMPNTSDLARAVNRRVEIAIMREGL